MIDRWMDGVDGVDFIRGQMIVKFMLQNEAMGCLKKSNNCRGAGEVMRLYDCTEFDNKGKVIIYSDWITLYDVNFFLICSHETR